MLTDHRPLVGIFRKQEHKLNNARLVSRREKLTNFSFKVKWVEGKTHMIVDALSRAEEEEGIDTSGQRDYRAGQHRGSKSAANKTDTNFKQLLGHHPARKLLSISKQLSIEKLGETDVIMLDWRRILDPKGARKNIIRELLHAHSGLTKTFKTAKQLYFW